MELGIGPLILFLNIDLLIELLTIKITFINYLQFYE